MYPSPDPISRDATLTLLEQLHEDLLATLEKLHAAVEHLPTWTDLPPPGYGPGTYGTCAAPLDPRRQDLITTLQRMPDEAFVWFVLWAHGRAASPYPPTLSGFTEASRASIEQLRAAAEVYMTLKPGGA